MSGSEWIPNDASQTQQAKDSLDVWPLDRYNAVLLNEVHPLNYISSTEKPHDIYDIVAIGSGAGGLVSAKQAGRRGAKSAMISEQLAGGDCLNVGCVPSKALLSAAKAVMQVKRASEFGLITNGNVKVDFGRVMERMRRLRAQISPADGHAASAGTGAHVFQGRGMFTGPNTIRVGHQELKFHKAVIATGGRPVIPDIPGLKESPYTTNEILFNLETLPPRMVILGAGVIALEMAQAFAAFGSQVAVLKRTELLFQSKQGDIEAAELLQNELESLGVKFCTDAVEKVETLRERPKDTRQHPILRVHLASNQQLECECLLVAVGRAANVENLGLEEAGIAYETTAGVKVNDLGQTSNPNVYSVGDCTAGVPRLTHVSGEMAKLILQNSLFGDKWKISSLVIPAVAYTEPEYATVGLYSEEFAAKNGIKVDTYRAGLEHNDRAILESANVGYCKIFCKAGTDEIVGATIVAERAGEMINEVTLAMKNNIGLGAVGRNIHAYPTTGEAVMGCGIQYINAHLPRKNTE